MSKKSSTFAAEMMKKEYIYPYISIIRIDTEHLMGMVDGSGGDHGGYAPERREPF